MSNSIKFTPSDGTDGINFTKDEFLTSDFYIHSISLFLINSYGIKDRITAYINILRNVNLIGQKTFDRMNIFSDDYFKLNADVDETNYLTHDYLDVLASVFNIKREMEIVYYEDNIKHSEQAVLTDYDLLIYMQCKIFKMNFNGTRNDINLFYYGTETLAYDNTVAYIADAAGGEEAARKIVDPNKSSSLLSNINLHYIDGARTETAATRLPLTCDVVIRNASVISSNIRKLFLGGYLTIQSMGIAYNYVGTDFIRNGVFCMPASISSDKTTVTFTNPEYITYDSSGTIITNPAVIKSKASADSVTQNDGETTRFKFYTGNAASPYFQVSLDSSDKTVLPTEIYAKDESGSYVKGYKIAGDFGFSPLNVTGSNGYFGRFYSNENNDVTVFVSDNG